jgi:cytochrome c peroxidase
MKMLRYFLSLVIFFYSHATSAGGAEAAANYDLKIPVWAPSPNIPANNPVTAAKAELGRHLFYDKKLSSNGEMSCATCHQQAKAFTDGEATSKGVTGQKGIRSAMSLTNAAYLPILTWSNPNLNSLEVQALIPLFGEHPIEMGMSGRERLIFKYLENNTDYQQLFASAFPKDAVAGSGELYNLENITQALATFQRTLISFNSPYDRYKHLGQSDAISDAAKAGEQLFFGEKLECYHCHGGITFTDNMGHTRNPFPEIGYHNTGLYNTDGRGGYPQDNQGLYEVTLDIADMGKFRTPTLRNIALTAPYMHDGSILTLEDVIRKHYAEGGKASLSEGGTNPMRSPFMKGFEISDTEVAQLLEFLNSLTDTEFVTNEKHSDPRTTQ